MNRTYIVSDLHLHHKNIIEYTGRPFSTVEEMDETLIDNWNSVVNHDDTIIHLGDFCLGPRQMCMEYAKRLNGKKYFLRGNHDRFQDGFYRTAGFTILPPQFNYSYETKHHSYPFILSHYPMNVFNNIYGHIHDKENMEKGFCACVEKIDYTPILMSKVKEIVYDTRCNNSVL